MVTLVVVLVIVALVFSLVIAVALDPGPSSDDVAVSYELAWDRLDFEAVWSLSAEELRDGRQRKAFVADKQQAYSQASTDGATVSPELSGLAAHVVVEDVATSEDTSIVHTRVELHDGKTVRNRVELVRRDGRWQVRAYELTPTP